MKRWMDTGSLRARPSSVDLESGIIRGVKICSEGEAKGHDVSIDSEFISTVVQQGAAFKNGLKARFGHPNMCSDSLGTFVGRFKNFSRSTTDRGGPGGPVSCCVADLHLSNTAKFAPGGDLYAYIVAMADTESDMFGTSIVFHPGAKYRRDNKGLKVYQRKKDANYNSQYDQVGGPEFIECDKLLACDCVDNPAANDGLFSAFADATIAGQITEFFDLNPQIFEFLENSPGVMSAIAQYGSKIDEFFVKYREHIKEADTTAGTINQHHSDLTLTAAMAAGSIGKGGGKPPTRTPPTKEKQMDLVTLKEQFPELVAALIAEATAGHTDQLNTAVTAARSEGAEAERQRIADVRAQAIPGHEALIEQLAADGTSSGADAAMAIIAAEKSLRAQAAKAATTGNPPAVAIGDPVNTQGKTLKRAEFQALSEGDRRAHLAAGGKITD